MRPRASGEPHLALTVSGTTPMIPSRSAPGSKPALTDSELAEPRGFSLLRHSSLTLTAVLVDGGFFLKRAAQTPDAAARQLHRIALDHLKAAQAMNLGLDGLTDLFAAPRVPEGLCAIDARARHRRQRDPTGDPR